MSWIVANKKGKHTYYELWDKGKFSLYIGNAAKLQAFQRDMQIGEEAAKLLTGNNEQVRHYRKERGYKCLNVHIQKQ